MRQPQDPKERFKEKIGGGFLVYRRGKKTGRVSCRYDTMPFEHPSLESALKEVERLEKRFPGERFTVWMEI